MNKKTVAIITSIYVMASATLLIAQKAKIGRLTQQVFNEEQEIEALKLDNNKKVRHLQSANRSLTISRDEIMKEAKDKDKFIEAMQKGSKWKVAEGVVTAYAPYDNKSGTCCEGDPSKTSTGTRPDWGTIAVDPKRIPYGSEIIIIYKDGIMEKGVAVDTGGALRKAEGILIDVYRDTYEQTRKHGRKEATIIWKPNEEK